MIFGELKQILPVRVSAHKIEVMNELQKVLAYYGSNRSIHIPGCNHFSLQMYNLLSNHHPFSPQRYNWDTYFAVDSATSSLGPEPVIIMRKPNWKALKFSCYPSTDNKSNIILCPGWGGAWAVESGSWE